MATKKITKRAQNRAKTTRGKPFAKGNPHAFKPGQSGNPGGRPKSRHVSDAYRQWLAQLCDGDPEMTNADAIAEVVGRAALKGDLWAVKEITDRVEGKARQPIEINEEEGERKWLYGRMVERVIERARTEGGQVITREKAIDLIAAYKPEIRDYITE